MWWYPSSRSRRVGNLQRVQFLLRVPLHGHLGLTTGGLPTIVQHRNHRPRGCPCHHVHLALEEPRRGAVGHSTPAEDDRQEERGALRSAHHFTSVVGGAGGVGTVPLPVFALAARYPAPNTSAAHFRPDRSLVTKAT